MPTGISLSHAIWEVLFMAGKQQKTSKGRTKKASGSKSTKNMVSQKNKKVIEELTAEEREQQEGIRNEVVLLGILAVSVI